MYHAEKSGTLQWTSLIAPTEADLNQLQTTFNLSPKYRSYIRDGRERSRFDFDERLKMGLLIWRVAVTDQEQQNFQVVPVSFIITADQLVSVVSSEAQWVAEKLQELLTEKAAASQQKDSPMLTLLRLLWRINDYYVDQIDLLNHQREKLANYRKHPTNEQITALAELSDQLVYLTTASDNNVVAIQQMQLSSRSDNATFALKPKELDFLSDVEVETKQSQQVTQDAADLVDRLSNTYNNLLNNNLNETMRFLTVWSLVLAVPPIISGFYGMNMHLPWAKGEWAWVTTLVLTAALIWGTLWIYHHYRSK